MLFNKPLQKLFATLGKTIKENLYHIEVYHRVELLLESFSTSVSSLDDLPETECIPRIEKELVIDSALRPSGLYDLVQ